MTIPERYRAGLHKVGAYQISAIPFLSSSITVPDGNATIVVGFPMMTRFVTIRNELPTSSAAAPLRFGFSAAGVTGSNYYALENGESYTAEWRVSEIYLMASSGSTRAGVAAGLTVVDATELPTNWSGVSGVG